MKKAFAILLIMFYSLSSFGVTLKAFYCCGKLKSVSVVLSEQGKPQHNKTNCSNNCCKIQYKFFRSQDQHTTPVNADFNFYHSNGFHLPCTAFISPVYSVQGTSSIHSPHAPPLYTGVPEYIANRVFRI